MVPPRVAVFCWVARLQKILTADNLKIGHILVHGYPPCLAEEESPNHLLIDCNYSTKVWAELGYAAIIS